MSPWILELTSPTYADSGIDAETIALLREHKDVLFKEFVAALDAFYVRHDLLAGAESLYKSEENVAYSRECNCRHWHIMMEGRFDAEYEKSVDAIHSMRNEISFDPRCSTSGYNFVLARVVEGLALRLPAKRLEFGRGGAASRCNPPTCGSPCLICPTSSTFICAARSLSGSAR